MTARANGKWQGMNWIRQSKRLAIYLRDGLACAWCGTAAEKCVVLTLDHLKPHSKGGTNDETNLVTCCKHCNDSRGNRSLKTFARVVAAYANHGITAEGILAHIKATSKIPLRLHKVEAERMIARRGSVFAAMNSKGKK